MKPIKRATAFYIFLLVAVTAFLYGQHQRQNKLAQEELRERFTKTASAYVEKAEALNETISKERSSFQLEKFSSVQDLQKELDRLFPFGTSVSKIDAVFVGQLAAFRSDNLIKHWKTGLPGNGSSSDKNYVYYYKPAEPSGENGWEDTSSGWVVKITHGNVPRARENKVNMMFGGGGKGLKEIHALATPQEQTETEFGEPVAFVKELLQYKIDIAPVETFDQVKWSALVTKHQSSPCKNGLTNTCLMGQALSLLDISDAPENRRYLGFLAEIAIKHGDKQTATSLLEIWPAEKEIRAYEESIPRLRRLPAFAIEGRVLMYRTQKMLLLFMTGAYDEAEAMLAKLQEEKKTGNDYRVISSLIRWGELDKALDISKLTLKWERQTPDPNENSSAILHCQNYRETRPEAMGKLAPAYIERAKLSKAYEVSQMVRQYWENKAYGQRSFCYIEAAKRSYISAMQALLKAYADKGEKDKAREIFDELRDVLQNQTDKVRYHTKWAFEQIARTAAENGIAENTEELAKFVNAHSSMEYYEIHNRTTNDPVPLIYALAGSYDKAIARIEGHSYEKKGPPQRKMDKFWGPRDTPDNEIRLTTYLKIAGTLADMDDKEGALLFLDKATPYLGSRTPQYDPAVANLSDYITKAEILLKIGETQKSRKVLDELLGLFNETTEKDYRGGAITKNFYGQFAYLYARHENIAIVQKWADRLPSFYSGNSYARIAALLVKEGRWDELDAYMPEMARVLSTDAQPIQNWYSFFHALIDIGEFDRYLQFMDMLTERTDAEQERQNTTLQQIGKQPQTPDTRPQIQMMNKLLVSKLSGDDVPQNIIDSVWPRFITNCRMWDYNVPHSEHQTRILPNAEETMAACYIGIIKSVADFERFAL